MTDDFVRLGYSLIVAIQASGGGAAMTQYVGVDLSLKETEALNQENR
jgi:hypothetical protein